MGLSDLRPDFALEAAIMYSESVALLVSTDYHQNALEVSALPTGSYRNPWRAVNVPTIIIVAVRIGILRTLRESIGTAPG